MEKIKTFGEVDRSALEQLIRCAEQAEFAVLCADHHKGYSQPIGGAIAYKDYISPSGVGYDIACGNKAVRTPVLAADVDVPKVMDEIARSISFGVGRVNQERVDHPVLDTIAHANFAPQQQLLKLASEQLGTVGSGNHYVDLFEDEDGYLWVGVHFGSRGFGHRTATGFMAIAQGLSFFDKAHEGEMDAPPLLLDINSQAGQDYIEAMNVAGEYAYAGRDWVVNKVLSILGTHAVEDIHNHHNFAWREKHFDQDLWVVRKGCTPAFPGQKGFVGGSMGDISVILEGVDSDSSAQALYSTVHGAGRVMSRTQAAGKKRKVSVERTRPDGSTYVFKEWKQVAPGVVDWPQVKTLLEHRGIELRGGGADEAPEVYKQLKTVLEAHDATIRVLHTLKPIGVAMAGADTFDPYKD